MSAVRADGALVVSEFGLDSGSRMVKRRKALRPHEQWLDDEWISRGQHDAADKYLKAYERGLCGARNMLEPPKDEPSQRFHEARSHWMHLLMRAQEALRAHERTVLDCTLVCGMSLDAYGAEVLLLPHSRALRVGQVRGLITASLATLCEHWRIRA